MKKPMHPDTAFAFGCSGVVVAVILSCSLSSIFRSSDLDAMHACGEACGPGRMAEYTTTRCECIDEVVGPAFRVRLTEPMIPVDAGAIDQ
jgi:hypothetical protein